MAGPSSDRASRGLAGAIAPALRPARPRRALLALRVGRWPSVVPGPAGLRGTVAQGWGKRGSRFLFPPTLKKALSPLHWQGPSPLPRRCAGIIVQPGAKAPGQRPTRPRRALRPRRVGRWPVLFWDLPVCGAPSRAGGGNAVRFLIPPSLTKALPPLEWQGPSPLPQRYAGIRTGRGPQPPASARPAHGGRFPPAGSGAGLSWCLDPPVYRAPSHAGGETRVAFPDPPGGTKALSPLQWQGPSPLPQRHADP